MSITTPPDKPEATEIQCPVCGYYCLGKGGMGCIDKPTMVEMEEGVSTDRVLEKIAEELNAIYEKEGWLPIASALTVFQKHQDQLVKENRMLKTGIGKSMEALEAVKEYLSEENDE